MHPAPAAVDHAILPLPDLTEREPYPACPLCGAVPVPAAEIGCDIDEGGIIYGCGAAYEPPGPEASGRARWTARGACSAVAPQRILALLWAAWMPFDPAAPAEIRPWLLDLPPEITVAPDVWLTLPALWRVAAAPKRCPHCEARGEETASEIGLRHVRYECGGLYLVSGLRPGFLRRYVPFLWEGYAPCRRPKPRRVIKSIRQRWPGEDEVLRTCDMVEWELTRVFWNPDP